MSLRNDTLTAVPGIAVGHAEVSGWRSGCTVVLGPFRGAVEIGGSATGSRELETLQPTHIVPRVDAVLLTGGSAWGLAAADGVADWLEEQGRGYRTSVALVPIVPAAVLFDLEEGKARPTRTTGRTASERASPDPVAQGRVGAGAGASVGKILGGSGAMPTGVGSAALRSGGTVVGALVALNALGDVLDRTGSIVAGARTEEGGFLNTSKFLRRETAPENFGDQGWPEDVSNTTLAVVATDAPLSRIDLARVARVAATALPRCISPVNTPFDGDIVFALSTAPSVAPLSSGEILSLGVVARDVLEEAILRAARPGVDGPEPRRGE